MPPVLVPSKRVQGQFYSPFLMTDQWSVGGMMMDLRKPMYSEKNVSQRSFVHHEFHIDCPGINPLPPQTETGVKPSVLWHDLACIQPVYSNGSCVYLITLLTSPSCCVSRFVAGGPRFECGLMYFYIVRFGPAVTRTRICMKNETQKKKEIDIVFVISSDTEVVH
jgi:hypothetical protein